MHYLKIDLIYVKFFSDRWYLNPYMVILCSIFYKIVHSLQKIPCAE